VISDGSGKWEVGSGKWGSGKWEVGKWGSGEKQSITGFLKFDWESIILLKTDLVLLAKYRL
jgi:hypothetical protein